MFKMDCSELIKESKCKADCCGLVPIPEQTVKQFEHLKQRKVLEVVEWKRDIYPLTEDGRCVFMKPDYGCAIYESRPDICKNYGHLPDLQCPYIDLRGKTRTPAKQRRMQRIIGHEVDEKMRQIEKVASKESKYI